MVNAVSRKRTLAFIVAGLMLAMLCVLLYKAFDIHDTQPLGIDPELPLFMLGSQLLLCIGVLVLIARLLASSLSKSKALPLWFSVVPVSLTSLGRAFEVERLLFSPPLDITSFRVYRNSRLRFFRGGSSACVCLSNPAFSEFP